MPILAGNVVRRIIQQTIVRREFPAKNAKVRNTKQSSALRILHQTQYAHSVGEQGIQLRTAEPARKLRRKPSHKNQGLLEATRQTHQQPLLDRLKATLPQHQVQRDLRCKNKCLHIWYPH